MPNCFQLIRKSTTEAVPLIQLDKEMCAYFGQPCHPKRWLASWYDIIGWHLATGKMFDQIREILREDYQEFPVLLEIADWLDANFTARSWVEVGRREVTP